MANTQRLSKCNNLDNPNLNKSPKEFSSSPPIAEEKISNIKKEEVKNIKTQFVIYCPTKNREVSMREMKRRNVKRKGRHLSKKSPYGDNRKLKPVVQSQVNESIKRGNLVKSAR